MLTSQPGVCRHGLPGAEETYPSPGADFKIRVFPATIGYAKSRRKTPPAPGFERSPASVSALPPTEHPCESLQVR